MDDTDLELLCSAGVESTFAAGQTLIERGQPGSGLFVVLEGEVVVEAPDGTFEFGPGAVLGERALLAADGTRAARVRAVTEVRVVAVQRAIFDELCADDAGFADRIAAAFR
jgi:CRP-like cAMP-binding protein